MAYMMIISRAKSGPKIDSPESAETIGGGDVEAGQNRGPKIDSPESAET